MKKHLCLLMLLSCATAYSSTVSIKVNNQSGHILSADLISSTCSHYNQLASDKKQCVAHYAYDFTHGKWDTRFVHDNSVIELHSGVNVLKFDSSYLRGGARLYIAKGDKQASFKKGMNPAIPGAPDLALYDGVYDKIELGWNDFGTAVWNLTYVDFFGMPLQLEDTQSGKVVGIAQNVNRSTVLEQLKTEYNKQSHIYDSSYYLPFGEKNLGDRMYRIFSPQHFYTQLNAIDPWRNYIDMALKSLHSQGKKFKFRYGQFSYSNLRLSHDGVIMIHFQNEENKSDSGDIEISELLTGNAVAGEVKSSPSHAAGKNFAGMLSAAINRGVLNDPDAWGTSGATNTADKYYQYWYGKNKLFDPSWMDYNPYAKVLTELSIDNKIYAVSYDDFWHMDNGLQVGKNNKDAVVLTVLPFANDGSV